MTPLARTTGRLAAVFGAVALGGCGTVDVGDINITAEEPTGPVANCLTQQVTVDRVRQPKPNEWTASFRDSSTLTVYGLRGPAEVRRQSKTVDDHVLRKVGPYLVVGPAHSEFAAASPQERRVMDLVAGCLQRIKR